jgi:hypothetical protein
MALSSLEVGSLLCTSLEDLIAMVVGNSRSRHGLVFDPNDSILADTNARPTPMMNPCPAPFRGHERLFKHRGLFVILQNNSPADGDFSKGSASACNNFLLGFPKQDLAGRYSCTLWRDGASE